MWHTRVLRCSHPPLCPAVSDDDELTNNTNTHTDSIKPEDAVDFEAEGFEFVDELALVGFA